MSDGSVILWTCESCRLQRTPCTEVLLRSTHAMDTTLYVICDACGDMGTHANVPSPTVASMLNHGADWAPQETK